MTKLLVKPASGWVDGCKYGDPSKWTDRHYVVLCVGGPLDGQYITFHGEAPGNFVHPSGKPPHWWSVVYGGEYQRVHECESTEDAVFTCVRLFRNTKWTFIRHAVVSRVRWYVRRATGALSW